jgi:hypothetical protein
MGKNCYKYWKISHTGLETSLLLFYSILHVGFLMKAIETKVFVDLFCFHLLKLSDIFRVLPNINEAGFVSSI